MPHKAISKSKNADDKHIPGIDYGEPITSETPSPLLHAGIADIQHRRPRIKSREEFKARLKSQTQASRTHAERVEEKMKALDERRNFLLNATDEEREQEIERLRPTYRDTKLWPEIEQGIRFGSREWLINLKSETLKDFESIERRSDRTAWDNKWEELIKNWIDKNPEHICKAIAKHKTDFSHALWDLAVVLNFQLHVESVSSVFAIYLQWLTSLRLKMGGKLIWKEGHSTTKKHAGGLESEAGMAIINTRRAIKGIGATQIANLDGYLYTALKSNLLKAVEFSNQPRKLDIEIGSDERLHESQIEWATPEHNVREKHDFYEVIEFIQDQDPKLRQLAILYGRGYRQAEAAEHMNLSDRTIRNYDDKLRHAIALYRAKNT
jgi:hypothetical protein